MNKPDRVIEYLRDRFSYMSILGPDIYIDETMMPAV